MDREVDSERVKLRLGACQDCRNDNLGREENVDTPKDQKVDTDNIY